MRVTLDLTSAIQLLRRGEVVGLGVDEEASLEVADSNLDGERSVGSDGPTVLGVRDLSRGHVVDAGDSADGGWVAGARLDLLSVGDGKVGGQAEVDEVVRRSERSDLA